MSLQREISESINASKIGRTVEAIIDGISRTADVSGFSWEGRTQWDAPEVDGNVFVKGARVQTGEIIPVVLQRSNEYDLFGEFDSVEKAGFGR